ncbi:MAG: tyrosine-type recombinase/integrase [Candidatus Omnitrophica bacterium]|nr:tyrosine-type recombinase/integrase [Candidatus Omnitrophota bacterium]
MLKQEEFLQALATRGFKQSTIQCIEIYLNQFYLWLCENRKEQINQVSRITIQAYQKYLCCEYLKKNGQKLCQLTILAKLSTLRKYFRYLVKQKEVLLDPTINIELPRSRDYLPKDILTMQEAENLLDLPDKTILGIRDKAILELLYSSAIRRKELCDLELYDINLKDKTIHIRTPKNRRDRIVPIGNKAKEAIERYLLTSRVLLTKNTKEKAVFLTFTGKRIRKETLNYMVKKYSKQMKINKKITPHCLRHSCATHLLQNGSNLVIIQKILGHSRISTTEIYTRIVPEDLKLAINKYHPRWRMKAG